MSAILEMPEVRARALRWSVKDYDRLGERGLLAKNVELIRGVIVKKMSKFPLHRALAKRFYDRLLNQAPAGYVVFQEGPLHLMDDSEPEPDVAVVRGSENDFSAKHPTTAALVVEVAVSSAALDRANTSLYAESGVPEYWIVLGRERQVEVYRQPVSGVYQQKRVYAVDETLICESVPELQVPLDELFA